MNITGTARRLNMYKVCWADCYGEDHTDYKNKQIKLDS